MKCSPPCRFRTTWGHSAVLLTLTVFFLFNPGHKFLPNKAGSSKSHQNPPQYTSAEAELDALYDEIPQIQQKIEALQALLKEKSARLDELQDILLTRTEAPAQHGFNDGQGKGKARAVATDYRAEFEWSQELRLRLKKVFDISSFRLVQEP